MAKKILIIEDDPTALRLTEYTLKQRGHQVLTTCNGLEGIITAQKEGPDLVILDIMLPGIDGFEVCRRLRASAQTADTPILILSGKAEQEDIATGFKVGASDYLPKPATPSDIISRVEGLLADRPAGQSKIIACISPNKSLGTTMILVNLAAAVSEPGKQVTLVDVEVSRKSNINQAPPFPQRPDRVVLETESLHDEMPGPAAEVLPSGVRMIHLNEVPESVESPDTDSADLLHKLGDVNDYLLVNLPFSPTPFTRSTFSQCDLIIIASDYRINSLSETQDIINLLRFLGVTQERIAVVLVDSEGSFPSASLSGLKPYIEANLGVSLAGTVSFDVKTYQLSYLESQPVVRSSPHSQLARDIRSIAQYITAHSNPGHTLRQNAAGAPYLEKD